MRVGVQSPGTPIEPEVKEILSALVSVGPCDADGNLVPDSSVIQAVSPTQAPKPKPGPGCAP